MLLVTMQSHTPHLYDWHLDLNHFAEGSNYRPLVEAPCDTGYPSQQQQHMDFSSESYYDQAISGIDHVHHTAFSQGSWIH
jgi:hypothetical protein